MILFYKTHSIFFYEENFNKINEGLNQSNSNNSNTHTQNFVKTLNSNHSISFNPAPTANSEIQNSASNNNVLQVQQPISNNGNLNKFDISGKLT